MQGWLFFGEDNAACVCIKATLRCTSLVPNIAVLQPPPESRWVTKLPPNVFFFKINFPSIFKNLMPAWYPINEKCINVRAAGARSVMYEAGANPRIEVEADGKAAATTDTSRPNFSSSKWLLYMPKFGLEHSPFLLGGLGEDWFSFFPHVYFGNPLLAWIRTVSLIKPLGMGQSFEFYQRIKRDEFWLWSYRGKCKRTLVRHL